MTIRFTPATLFTPAVLLVGSLALGGCSGLQVGLPTFSPEPTSEPTAIASVDPEADVPLVAEADFVAGMELGRKQALELLKDQSGPFRPYQLRDRGPWVLIILPGPLPAVVMEDLEAIAGEIPVRGMAPGESSRYSNDVVTFLNRTEGQTGKKIVLITLYDGVQQNGTPCRCWDVSSFHTSMPPDLIETVESARAQAEARLAEAPNVRAEWEIIVARY